MHEDHTRNEEHETAAPLARPSILDQLAFEREIDRLRSGYEPPRPEDYHAY